MKLLKLPEGMVSLEFLPSERDELMRRLRHFGTVKRQPQASYDRISVGAVQLIHEDEWDEPCLISTSAAGADLLREVASKSTSSKAA
jgi:hypothetical protein